MNSVRPSPIMALAVGVLCVTASAPARTATPKTHTASVDVQPEAVQALKRMSIYLGTLPTFEVVADATDEAVMESGQKLQFAREVTYRVRRPDGFVIETMSDRKIRRFYYDGRHFTVFAPRVGVYATADAPPTIRQTLDVAYDKFGITLPLEDLFRWDQQNTDPGLGLTSGLYIGYAKIEGMDCDQYAFRERGADWQIWIRQGPEPVPIKVVITDRHDPAAPQFAATLRWNVKPSFAADAFTFQPGKDDQRIRIAGQDSQRTLK